MGAVRAWAALVAVLIAWEPPTLAATYTWTGGGGANTNWSSMSNWGGSAPSDNETGVGLVFPALAGHYASHNDLSGLHVISLAVTTQLSNGSYVFTGNAITLQEPVTMDSPDSGSPNLVWQIPIVLGGDVTLTTSGRQTQVQAPIDLGSHTLRLDANGDVVLAGVISGSGNLIKDNSSALSITGANTYTGSTTGNRGALYIGNAAAFGGTGTGTTFNGGFLGFLPGSAFITAEPFVFNGGGIIAYGTPTMAGQVTLGTTISIQTFDAPATLTMSGAIAGSGGLNKTGPGLLILNAPSDSYAGATGVEAGTLRLDAALSSASPVTVKSGATLRGSGASGGTISVQDGGTVAPGASPGELASHGLAMVGGSTFAAEINGPTPVTQYDRLAVTGPVSLGGATLGLTLGYAPADGQEFTLISQLQGEPVSGTFAGLAEGASFQIGATTLSITYQGGSGHDVLLTAGPPPPTATTTTTPAATVTATRTPTGDGSITPTVTVAPPTLTPTPTPTGLAAVCTGDCDGNGTVAINELVLGVTLALDGTGADACAPLDADGNDRITIQELIQAVGNALNGCPPAAAESACPPIGASTRTGFSAPAKSHIR